MLRHGEPQNILDRHQARERAVILNQYDARAICIISGFRLALNMNGVLTPCV